MRLRQRIRFKGDSGTSYLWTDQTRLLITAVPEPDTIWMMGAGLVAVGAAVRRRKR
ncbi:PEP-CTERM sorting domain-containing protein [Pseudoduganella chitinolytica]|uniref:PEP-CTERM sorting domain-containing protein n=1 Tax=Pseudoduganella chitinolytica TaxID=34070 RepID=UPI0035312B0A